MLLSDGLDNLVPVERLDRSSRVRRLAKVLMVWYYPAINAPEVTSPVALMDPAS
jgi:hypothetical protein